MTVIFSYNIYRDLNVHGEGFSLINQTSHIITIGEANYSSSTVKCGSYFTTPGYQNCA